ncbi:MAG: hypothetical protein H6R15_3824 [Proteobacteria bacterium]|nr:hypothetical protein [Pseudomonadota bacterium]
MQTRILVLAMAAAFAAGCVSNESKTDSSPAAAPATTSTATAAPVPVAGKPECPPEATGKKKKTAKTKTDKSKTAAIDCEPAKPKSTASSSQVAEPAPATTPAPASAKEAAKPTEAGKPRMMKSRDGTFEGEVYGNPPANSKWAKLQIGMEQPEVERILGGSSNDVRTMPTGKAFIPFYFGTDRYRYEVVYHGQGSVSYTGGSWGGGRGILMMINYDPKM